MARLGYQHHNLPEELSSFIGRERERTEVAQLLRSTRLLTLAGAGGAGKTRLALRVATDVLADYVDGVWLVELGPLVNADLIPQAVGLAIGVREQMEQPIVDTLVEALSRSCALLVLDNCEHVVQGCANLVERLLRACSRLTVLATSREPLRVAGEVIWRLPPLTLHDQVVGLEGSDAVQLLFARARETVPGFELTEDNLGAMANICRRLDCMPLAIELAAARIRLLSPTEIAARLDDRFKLLTGGNRTAAARQQTLAATVSWSYDTLSAAERHLFERLSVFAGGFSLDAAEAVCGPVPSARVHGDEVIDVLDLLSCLVDRSLVVVESHVTGASTRYRLLESLRAFASERLLASGDTDRIHRRQADWLVKMAEQAEAAFHGPEQGRWLRWAQAEHANVRVVLQRLIDQRDTDAAMRLIAALWWSWIQRGTWSESQIWHDQALALPGAEARTRTRAKVLAAAGALAVIGGGDPTLGRQCLEESLSIGLEVDEPYAVVNARGLLEMVAGLRGETDLAQAEVTAVEILDYARETGTAWGENRALVGLAQIALAQGDFQTGSARLEDGVRVARAAGDAWSLAMTQDALGDLERSRGAHARAGELYEESLAVFAQIGLAEHPLQRPHLMHNLGYVALAAGQFDEAAERFANALLGYQRAGDRRGVAECLIGSGATAAADGRGEMAVRLFAAGEAALEAARIELWHSNRRDYEYWRGVAHALLDAPTFDSSWAEGRQLSIADAIALTKVRPPKPAPAEYVTRPPLGGLTARERDVARLVAAGLTNRQIADRLIITEKTAANHVQRVLGKLGVHARAQLAARSAEFGL